MIIGLRGKERMQIQLKLSTLYEKFLANLPLAAYLSAYFLTVVLGNILYQTQFGVDLPYHSIGPSWYLMDTSIFGMEFNALIFLPLLAMPFLALKSRDGFSKPIQFLAKFIPEFNRYVYLIMNICSYSYVIYRLSHFKALSLLMSGHDQIAAVNARFLLLNNLGFHTQLILLSLLPFMAVYAIIAAMRTRTWFWMLFAVWHFVVLTSCLVLLNMKWPLVLWIITVGIAVMVALRTLKALCYCGAILLLAGGIFFGISTLLQRQMPILTQEAQVQQYLHEFPVEYVLATDPKFGALARQDFLALPQLNISEFTVLPTTIPNALRLFSLREMMQRILILDHPLTTMSFAKQTLLNPVNRMAIPVLYYYSIFSQEKLCGTLVDRIKRKPSPCSPSLLVYQTMFVDDGFAGRGTAPAASHITGYALNGWFGLLLCLTLTGILIGMFLILWPLTGNSIMLTTIFVMGAQAAYFWSQLPIEGPIVYNHGIMWWGLLIILYSLLSLQWLKK